jgi:putative transposase
MVAIEAVTTIGETAALCQSVGLARATLYRRRQPARPLTPTVRTASSRALIPAERQAVLDVLHSERFVDQSPAEVHATLLEEQTYLCSTRTMYRILDAAQEVRERRDQARHPVYAKPELVATAPNQIWSWDITKLKGPIPYLYYSLYVILDLFSRYVVGWMVAHRETAELAEQLIADTLQKENIAPDTLTLHADRGTSMRSKPVAALLIDLDVAKTHSRPHVSNDNPYSESHFKTLKYRPEFPDRFGSIEDARAHCQQFFRWYNHEHRHGGIGLMTPAAVHDGIATELTARRALTLDAAFAAHPIRFKGTAPKPPVVPTAAWINPPKKEPAPTVITPVAR